MLKATLNSSLRLIHTKNLYSDGDELSVVYCIQVRSTVTENSTWTLYVTLHNNNNSM